MNLSSLYLEMRCSSCFIDKVVDKSDCGKKKFGPVQIKPGYIPALHGIPLWAKCFFVEIYHLSVV